MKNFNTNQTRHLYVAEAIDSNLDTNLDIVMGTLQSGEIYFKYKNADGMLVRSDTIDPKKVSSLKKAYATGMGTPLKCYKIALAAVPAAGKEVKVDITVNNAIDYDSEYHVITYLKVDGTAHANVSKFHNDLARKIFANLSTDKGAKVAKIYVITSGAATEITAKDQADTASVVGLLIVENPTKYVRGKLSGEPCPLDVVALVDGEPATVTPVDAATQVATTSNISPTVFPAVYTIADLEDFDLGERGDYYRGFMYPNDYTPTKAVDLSKTYDMLSIEYYWAGDAENVQKSPRLIEIAMPHAVSDNPIDALYDAVAAAINGTGSGSGAGA